MVLDMAKTEVQREYHLVLNVGKRCCEKVDSQGGHFTGIDELFLRDPVHRESQLAIGWTEPSTKSGINLQKKTIHIILLQRKRKDTKGNGIFL